MLRKLGSCLVCVFLLACSEDDPIPEQTSIVTIEAFEFVSASSLNARTSSNTNWIHPLDDQIQLVFRETIGSRVYNFNINPNDPGSSEIILPYGTYDLSSEGEDAAALRFLPMVIDESITLSNPNESLVLQAGVNHGLVTLDKEDLEGSPSLENVLLAENQGYYYLYLRHDESGILTIQPKGSNVSFEVPIIGSLLLHSHIDLEFDDDREETQFSTPDFSFTEEDIKITEEGYPASLKPNRLGTLTNSQFENSGLAFIDGRLFSINDGGNTPEIYELDPNNGEVLRVVELSNVDNIDWEDLALSDESLFIGDFGNNQGTRQDLRVLKLPIVDVLNNDDVMAEVIPFSYEDQIDFSGANPNHDFDCEAFIYQNGSLHLFTKNRSNESTNHYSLNANGIDQIATRLGELEVGGQITAADWNPETSSLILLGYKLNSFASTVFSWEISEFEGSLPLSGAKKRYDLGSPLNLGQTEGIAFKSVKEILLSAEGVSQGPFEVGPSLYEFSLPLEN